LGLACRSSRLASAKGTPSGRTKLAERTRWHSSFSPGGAAVDRILRGAKPADLSVQFPTKFEMAINLKTAKALGLNVPQSILLRARSVK
jgi:hypothetical protein